MNALIEENIAALQQAIALLPSLDETQYRQKLPACFNASVGGHIRHNVDHYLSFLAGFEKGQIDYETRERDARLEGDRDYAIVALEQITARLRLLVTDDKPIQVRMENTADTSAEAWGGSTARRELQFLLSHTIHHYALVAVSCRLLGIEPSADFGVAPSTLRYRKTLNLKVA